MSDIIVEQSTNYIEALTNSVGPVWATIIFVGVLGSVILFQWIFNKVKSKNKITEVEIRTKAIINEILTEKLEKSKLCLKENTNDIVDEIRNYEEVEAIILETMETIAHSIVGIEKKLKHTLSNTDIANVFKFVTTGNLLFDIIGKSMEFSTMIRNKPTDILALREQFTLEVNNIWSEYVARLNIFPAQIKIGDFINKMFYEKHTKPDGLFEKITAITFDTNIESMTRYSRINTIFSNYTQNATYKLINYLSSIDNGEE